MEHPKYGERITPSFFQQMKPGHKKEEIFALLHADAQATETRVPEDIWGIASDFYQELWKKRKDPRN